MTDLIMATNKLIDCQALLLVIQQNDETKKNVTIVMLITLGNIVLVLLLTIPVGKI